MELETDVLVEINGFAVHARPWRCRLGRDRVASE